MYMFEDTIKKYDCTKLLSSAKSEIKKKRIKRQFSISEPAEFSVIYNCYCLHTGTCRHPSLVTEVD